MMLARRLLIVLLLGVPFAAQAANLPVSYLVNLKTLKESAPAGTALTFTLYSDTGCTTQVAQETVNVENVNIIESLKLLTPRGATRPPQTARITATLTGVSGPANLYLTVTGTGITSVGGACQPQAASAQGASAFASGMIMIWSGTIASIPPGWLLCNGSNGTPDLRDRFVIGAAQDSGGIAATNVTGVLTQTGGSATHTQTIAEMPAHHHSFTGFNDSATNGPFATVTATSQVNNVNTTDVGGEQAMNIMNPYFALAYIVKQ